MTLTPNNRFLYIFLDESGNFDFSKKGTKYFILGSITLERPFNFDQHLSKLKYDLVESKHGENGNEFFHATEDDRDVRQHVFTAIKSHLNMTRIDALVVEKSKTAPAVQVLERFYPDMLGYLLQYVLNGYDLSQFNEVIVFTDLIPINNKRKAIEKALKITLAKKLPPTVSYRVFHHASRSHYGLQVCDYCTWAIQRKWRTGNSIYYDLIAPAICSEFDIFESGTTYYY